MLKWVDKHLKVLFVAPCIIFVLLMIAFPLGYNLVLSFCKWSMSNVQPPQFVAFQNYIDLFKDERFWNAVGRTVYFVVVALSAETVLGVALAVLINRSFHGKRLAQTLFLLPVVATPVAIGMVWMLMYEPTIGFANVALAAFGIPPQTFLASSSQALNCLAIVDIWEWTPMVMLMVYAGLTAIPQDPYESALIDGANSWQKFTRITLPLVSPTILVAMLLRLIDVIKTFDIIYATTKGGPGFDTENINILAYTTSFSYFEFGKAAAITVLFFIVVIAISGGFLQIKKKLEVEY
ncbi:MAG: sugar ABC transporter permease [Oscillospiraceae bacterium]